MSKIYESKISTNHKNLELLKKELSRFLAKNKSVYCKALKRKIYLTKLPEAILKRKSSARRRLQRFEVAMDILKNAPNYSTQINKNNEIEYEVLGLSSNGNPIRVHLREEINHKKDKIVYFISCY